MGGKLLRAIGRDHHFAEGLTENLGLFEVPSIERTASFVSNGLSAALVWPARHSMLLTLE